MATPLFRQTSGSDPVGTPKGQLPALRCFHEVFRDQARRTPDATAVVFEGLTLTYAQVDDRTDRLAAVLRRREVGPEVIVALSTERGPRLILGMLAVLKAGGAYLPLDPAHPNDRLAFQLEDSGARMLLASQEVAHRFSAVAMPLCRIEELEAEAASSEPLRGDAGVDPSNLAYTIYTSGSTGRPKGVLVSHAGLATLVAAQLELFGAEAGKRVLQWAPPSFDASVFEILMAFGSGATLVLADRQTLMPGPDLLDLLEGGSVTHWTVPPSVLSAIDDGTTSTRLAKLENLVCAGEALPASLAAGWAGGRRLWNAYGPTEATVWSSVALCQPGERPTLGRALDGVRLEIADRGFEAATQGAAGELLIGGPVLARGYLGRPGLTAERFVPDPWSGEIGARLYRSGDAVRRLAGGELDFVGRVDHQIKIRGQRIEPAEVEAVLDGHPAVSRSYVMARRDGDAEPRLVAYVVAKGDGLLPALGPWLAERLPGALVPSAFVRLGELPLTANGKVDREALPAPAATDFEGLGGDDTAPRDPAETALHGICLKLWGVPRLGIHDDLFALGGHSLLVAQLAARVRTAFGVDLGLREIFAHPTVAALATLVRGGGAGRALPPMRRAPRDRPALLSFPQERVWFLNELAPGNVAYNSQATLTFEGSLDPGIYQRVLTEIVARHEVFRSRFPAVDGSPVQIVEAPMPVRLPVLDLQRLPDGVRAAESERLVYRALEEPFDLLEPPLARWILARHAPRRHVLIQVEHHFVHDGWSFGVLMGEMKALYTAFAAGEPSPLPEPPVQCIDFAAWQREWMQGEVLEEYLDYFTRMLEGAPPALELPTDRPRPPVQSFRGDAVRVDVPAALAEDLRRMVRETSMTLFLAMLASFKTLLWRYSGQRDLVLGTAAANRRLREMESMLGMAVNTLVLRTQLAPEMPFTALMRKLRDTAVGAFVYQDMPLDKLVERLDPERDLSRNPIFQAMFSFHDSPVPDMEFAGLEATILERHNGSAKADLNIVGIPRAEQRVGRERRPEREAITLIWEYSTDLFERTSMERMVRHYLELLRSAVAHPDRPLAALSLLSGAERREIESFGRGAELRPPARTLQALFENAAQARPDTPAVVDGARVWTYGELRERSRRLAARLQALGVGPETVVGLCLRRSPELVLAALGVLEAGGAYLPLDPDHPSERLAFTLADSQVAILLVGGGVPEGLADRLDGVTVLDLRGEASEELEGAVVEPRFDLDPGHRAYVIYTSGSTGRPKGTEVPHRGAVNLVAWHLRAFELGATDRCSLVASPAFDASVWETWPVLAAGAALHVVPEAVRTSPPELYRWLAREGITVAFLPTPLAEAMLEEEPPAGLALRILLVGGDRLRRAPRPGLPFRVINNYGPTEDSVVTTSGEVAPALAGPAPTIGRGLPNKRIAVLDRWLSPLPVGVPGELCIAGDGLARGYLRRPSLTAERFVPDPTAPSGMAGQRLYRTGDRVRWDAGGELHFLGRGDHQVKVRGYRIELGEIEHRLAAHPEVRVAAVVPLPGGSGLAAFAVADGSGSEALAEELRQHLAAGLPEYMVPAGIALVDALPLSPNGKVDRQALGRLAADRSWSAAEEAGEKPRGEAEALMATLWERLLGCQDVGRRDTFFALGGHSLLATRLVARILDAFGVELPVRTLFEAPTVAELTARVIEAQGRPGAGALPPLQPAPAGDEAPMSFAQERLWFLDRLIAHPAAYHIARAWGLEGPLEVAALEAAAGVVVARHEALRTYFVDRGGRPAQRRVAALAIPLPLVDLSALPPALAAGVAAELRAREGRRPFNLERLPLLRLTVLRLARQHHQLLLTQHHIISDGLSTGITLGDLSRAYGELLEGREPVFEPLPLRYADYALWQRRALDGDVLERLIGYWRSSLAGAPAVLELPLDHPRPSLQSFRGDLVKVTLEPAVAQGVRRLGRLADASWFMTLLGIYGAFLGRLSGQDEVVVGAPVAGRERPELEGIVGLFVNTIALRLSLAGSPAATEVLRRARETTLSGIAHQALPVERLVEALAVERDLSHAPIFQTLLVAGDPAMDTLALAGLEVAPVPVQRGESQFDLALFVREDGAGLELALRYDTALFDTTTALRIMGQLRTFVSAMVTAPDTPVRALPLLSAAQRQAVIREWNDTVTSFPSELCMHQLFEAQAARNPSATAVVSATGSLSYGELEAHANRLAHQLRALGAGPGKLVGVHIARREEKIVAVLAALKAGAAYVPLESSWPAERCRWIIDRKGIELLVTESFRVAALDDPAPLPKLRHVICLDSGVCRAERSTLGVEHLRGFSDQPPEPWAGPEDLAYIIFTSGSTGHPKGVMVRHRPAVNLIHWVNRTFGVGPGDRLLFTTALAFDLSVYDIFGILAAGATVRLASKEEVEDPQRLVTILLGEGVTFWDSAPAALVRLVPFLPEQAVEARLRLVFLSGDWIPVSLPDRVRRTFPQARVVSLGGATEATIWSNVFPIGTVDPSWASIPYGRPIDNARYHVVDENFEPCPVGVAGDLVIGGEVLSTGYAAEPGLTARQFVPDPFATAGERLYRTGDRARFWPDGNLEFLGRRDSQVKVRGYRIELGEIEAVLAEDPRLREVVVLVREDTPGDQRLVAYYTAETREVVDLGLDLKHWARSRLPEYMVPSAFVHLDTWPLTATGKLDRKALPSPEQRGSALLGRTPRSRMEATVAEVWCEVIGVSEVGRDDNFFDLGGHSLLIARVHARLQEALGRPVPMADLFRHPTVATMAASLVAQAQAPQAPAPETAAEGATPAAVSNAIAIVGMAGRFAAARDLEEFWQSLLEGRELIRSFSEEELSAQGVPPEVLADPRYVRRRGAVDDGDRFDAAFFGIPPREAEIIDPQHRVFLETSWQALEDAGYIAPANGERIGVYAGASASDYLPQLMADADLVRSVGEYAIHLGNQSDYLPARVAYKLDLQGPSLNVQTACSTSLVAVHLASQALLRGECELALAGGVCIRTSERRGYFYEDGGIASPDGRCRAFDADAAGTVGGSGVGVVVLKRLDRALADGDTVRAVVLGSALNNDGAGKVGFTAPSVGAQARAIRQAQVVAGVDAASIHYVEAHGTGTPMGDPIEVAALTEAFRATTEARGFCALGSVKSNVGHLDTAAGAAGLIKTVLALEHAEIPPSLHLERPNPSFRIEESPFRLAAERGPWISAGGPRRAGVSSFGIGGTNVHLVLEEAPPLPPADPAKPVQVLLLSAKTRTALDRMSERLAAHLETRSQMSAAELADVAYTLQVGRRKLEHRRVVICGAVAEAVSALRGEAPERVLSRPPGPQSSGVAFLFSGQGAQYGGMGARLYETEPVFRAEIDRAAEVLAGVLEVDLRPLLFGAGPSEAQREDADRRLADTRYAQPALCAIELALAALWRSLGVEPDALVGHSVGEYVAACLAGVFSFEDTLRLVAARGRLMAGMPGGAMLAVALSEAALQPMLEERGLELAAVNGPEACTVAGEEPAIEALAQELDRRHAEYRRLRTSHAFHSRAMEPILEDFAFEVMAVERQAPKRPFLSNLSGTWITPDQATDPLYWADHLRSPVRFADNLAQLLREERRWSLLEVGPGRQLATLARRHPQRSAAVSIDTSMPHPGRWSEDLETFARALGALWAAGVEPSWEQHHRPARRRRVPLPSYPFEGREYRAGIPLHAARGAGAARVAGSGDMVADTHTAVVTAAGGADLPRSATERALAAIWSEMLGVGQVHRGDDFFELGGSSLLAIRLSGRLEEELGIGVPVGTLLETSTLESLAQRIEAAAAGAPRPAASCLVSLAEGRSRSALFLVHQVGGQAYTFRALARALGGGQTVYALRSLGLEEGEEPLGRIEDMAEHYLSLIRGVQPQGPYLLGGASMGGMVAYEMAQRLRLEGESVGLLALFDTPCLAQMPAREDEATAIAALVGGHAGVPIDPAVLRRAEGFEARLDLALETVRRVRSGEPLPERAVLHRAARVLLGNAGALYAYRPKPYDDSALFFRAAERRPGDPPRPELAWIELVRGGLEFVVSPGNHLSMHEPPNVSVMAERLRRRLREVVAEPAELAQA